MIHHNAGPQAKRPPPQGTSQRPGRGWFPERFRERRHPWLAGALSSPALALGLTVASVGHWPDSGALVGLGLMLDGLRLHLAVAGVAAALALALLGRWPLVMVLVCLNVVGAGQALWTTHRLGLPQLPGAPVAHAVLWFNMQHQNPLPPAALIRALADSPADLVILAEATRLAGHLDDRTLTDAFPSQAGCRDHRCELLVLARTPGTRITLPPLYPPRTERLARITITPETGPGLTVLAMHYLKPWYVEYSNHDEWFLRETLGQTPGALVLVGDFNAAPWSARVQTLNADAGLRGVPRPPATWPASAGPLGVAIDQVFTRGGARVVTAKPWGAALGSNHRGLLVEVALAPG